MRIKINEKIVPAVYKATKKYNKLPVRKNGIWVTGVTVKILADYGITPLEILHRSFGWFFLINEDEFDILIKKNGFPQICVEL